jgi:hypothetical protein
MTATADRALQALHVLGLPVCREEEEMRTDGTRFIRHYILAPAIRLACPTSARETNHAD